MLSFKKSIRTVNRVFIHCSASDNPKHDDISVMKEWHLARGFKTVGYHFFIKKDGTVQVGRGIELAPAAQEHNNLATIAICLHGLDKTKFTDKQFAALRDLAKQINIAYNGHVTFHGHCEVSSKACPVFDYKTILNLTKEGKLQ